MLLHSLSEKYKETREVVKWDTKSVKDPSPNLLNEGAMKQQMIQSFRSLLAEDTDRRTNKPNNLKSVNRWDLVMNSLPNCY